MTLASEEAEAVLAAYDRDTREWSLSAKGEFWDAVRAAHEAGLTGKGTRIAILDTCPDMSFPQLQERLTVHNLRDDAPHSHGTAVALLMSSIAFQAEIHHYVVSEGGVPKRSLFKEAMERLEADPVDYVCLSLGDIQGMKDPDIAWAEPLIRQGRIAEVADRLAETPLLTPRVDMCFVEPCTCNLVERVRGTGAIVLAASGNADGKRFCPARTEGSVSVGFQKVVRKIENGAEIKDWVAPEGEQSDWVNYTVLQPPGVVGSSFATPIFVAALALRQGGYALNDLLLANELAAISRMLETLLDRHSEDPDIFASLVGQYEQIVDKAFGGFPHINGEVLTPTQMLEAGLFLVSPAVNMGRILLFSGRLGRALDIFAWARSVAPWLAAGHANWARTILTDAEYRLKTGDGDMGSLAVNLVAARAAYEEALALESENEAFKDGLAHVIAAQATVNALGL